MYLSCIRNWKTVKEAAAVRPWSVSACCLSSASDSAVNCRRHAAVLRRSAPQHGGAVPDRGQYRWSAGSFRLCTTSALRCPTTKGVPCADRFHAHAAPLLAACLCSVAFGAMSMWSVRAAPQRLHALRTSFSKVTQTTEPWTSGYAPMRFLCWMPPSHSVGRYFSYQVEQLTNIWDGVSQLPA